MTDLNDFNTHATDLNNWQPMTKVAEVFPQFTQTQLKRLFLAKKTASRLINLLQASWEARLCLLAFIWPMASGKNTRIKYTTDKKSYFKPLFTRDKHL